MIAYTIGNEANYDKGFAARQASGSLMYKTGKGDRGEDPEYVGGIVWSSSMAAEARAILWTLASGKRFAVYILDIPGTWEECTYQVEDDRHLLVDAVIAGKYDP